MKKSWAAALLAVGLVLGSAPAKAGDSECAVVLCLSVDGAIPSACSPVVAPFFAIQVWKKVKKSWVFDPVATAAKRFADVLSGCGEARSEDREFVNSAYGQLMNFPHGFY